MTDHPIVQLTFQNEHSGRFSGELGLLSSTIIEFVDRDGMMVELDRQIKASSDRAHVAFEAAMKSQGFKQWLAFRSQIRNEKRQGRFLERARSHVARLLKGSPTAIQLKMHWQTTSGHASVIESRYEAENLRKSLQTATRLWFIVLKPT